MGQEETFRGNVAKQKADGGIWVKAPGNCWYSSLTLGLVIEKVIGAGSEVESMLEVPVPFPDLQSISTTNSDL